MFYNNAVDSLYLTILLIVVGSCEFLANPTVLSLLLSVAVNEFSPIIGIESLNSVALLLYIVHEGFDYA